MGRVQGYVLVPDTRAICIAESSKYHYRVVVPETHSTQTQVSYSGTLQQLVPGILIRTLQQLVPGCAVYVYSYELVPAKATTFRLPTFAPLFSRVGKRNLVGLCVMTMRNDSLPVLFFSPPPPDAFYHFFGIFRRLRSSLTNAIYIFFKKRPVVIGFLLL